MKLIIDIPEDALKEMKTEEFISIESLDTAIECIKNGTPLDDVMAELQKLADDAWNMSVGSVSQGLEDAIEILDNIGKAEKAVSE